MKKDKIQYGHVPIVMGVKKVNSPCHDLPGEEVILSEKDGFTEFTTVCPECKTEFSNIELSI